MPLLVSHSLTIAVALNETHNEIEPRDKLELRRLKILYPTASNMDTSTAFANSSGDLVVACYILDKLPPNDIVPNKSQGYRCTKGCDEGCDEVR
jgi:hypothetical protein